MAVGEDTDANEPRPSAKTSTDIVASPAETAVASPDTDTVATTGASDVQTASAAACLPPRLDETVARNSTRSPMQIGAHRTDALDTAERP